MAKIIFDIIAMGQVEGRKPRIPAYITAMLMEMHK